ncbi:MAG TPA: hypothetical protein VNT27_17710 [Propionibacteriaceae bacterium]|nr:hypothetical protein [Propionibacteriaceae bacterium]
MVDHQRHTKNSALEPTATPRVCRGLAAIAETSEVWSGLRVGLQLIRPLTTAEAILLAGAHSHSQRTLWATRPTPRTCAGVYAARTEAG